MKNIQGSKLKLKETVLWLAMILLTIGALLGTYFLDFTTPIKALIWIAWLVLVLVLGFFTTQGKQIYTFSLEAKAELQKVVWPTRQETIQTTSIVMMMVAVTGFILWGIDSGMLWVIGKITHLG